jgi:hypothetical protein
MVISRKEAVTEPSLLVKRADDRRERDDRQETPAVAVAEAASDAAESEASESEAPAAETAADEASDDANVTTDTTVAPE